MAGGGTATHPWQEQQRYAAGSLSATNSSTNQPQHNNLPASTRSSLPLPENLTAISSQTSHNPSPSATKLSHKANNHSLTFVRSREAVLILNETDSISYQQELTSTKAVQIGRRHLQAL